MWLQADESGGTCSLEGSLPESPSLAEVCCCTVTPLGSGVRKNREKRTPSLPSGARSLTGGVTSVRTTAVQCQVPSWRGVASTVDSEEDTQDWTTQWGGQGGHFRPWNRMCKGSETGEHVRRRGQGRRTARAARTVSGHGSSCRPSLGRSFHPSRKRPAGWECARASSLLCQPAWPSLSGASAGSSSPGHLAGLWTPHLALYPVALEPSKTSSAHRVSGPCLPLACADHSWHNHGLTS